MKSYINKINENWDKFTKARALYIFTGLYYYYNPIYIYGSMEQKKQIYMENNFPDELTDKYIICNGWAKKYKSFLDSFGIKCEIKGDFHLYVLIYIDDFVIRADMMMSPYMDLMNIKMGFKTVHYSLIDGDDITFSSQLVNADKTIGYINENYNNELIDQKLNELKNKLKNKKLSYKYKELFKIFKELLKDGFIEKINLIKYLQDRIFDEDEISQIRGKINFCSGIFTDTIIVDDEHFEFSDHLKILNKK